MERTTLVGGQRVVNVHDPSLCEGQYCCVHNPSDHHMKDWPQNFRSPTVEAMTFGLHPGLMERICPHGVGHPDPDHMTWYASCHTTEETTNEGIHGCDGCCEPPAPKSTCKCGGSGRLTDDSYSEFDCPFCDAARKRQSGVGYVR